MNSIGRSFSHVARRLILAVAWGLALCGFLAMHALGSHGTDAHDAMPGGAVMTPAATLVGVTEIGRDVIAQADLEHAALPAIPGMSGGLAALCLAVLGGLVCLLVVLLALRSTPANLRPSWRSTGLTSEGRERDPPCLVRLSVMGC